MKLVPKRNFTNSTSHLIEAEKLIPLGSQTFSKSRTLYPVGISPLYLARSAGCVSWDLDGNKYIDLVSSLTAVTLGYGHRRINKAVQKQLKKGVTLSLPGILELEVSKKICDLVPSAEKVRFGKNGSDTTAAAVRVARAFTKRDRIAVCGYHGWQDWYIGTTTRNKGIPKQVSDLTHSFEYNNVESLEKLFTRYPGEFAAVIMEPMNSTYPKPGFLESVQNIAQTNGALLIFDETITGFRFSSGGAQKYFNVLPDISTFGKGIANGFPLSAIVGRAEIMKEMEEIFYSGTFAGELLSLAAANEVLKLHVNNVVALKLADIGTRISTSIQEIIVENKMESLLNISGHPSWIFLNWTENEKVSIPQLKTLFMQEMFKNGILITGTISVSLAMKRRQIQKIIKAFDIVLKKVSEVVFSGDIERELQAEPLQPLFQIR